MMNREKIIWNIIYIGFDKGGNEMAAVHVTKENFDTEVLKSDKPVLIDFWASWCGPCQMLAPIIEELAEEVTDVKVVKISTEEAPELAEQFSVMYIPTLVYMENGQVKDVRNGFMQKQEILQMIGK